MPKRIALLHYAGPPTVGGVESVIGHHARMLARFGYDCCIVAGNADLAFSGIETRVEPLFSSLHPRVIHAKTELDRGVVGQGFAELQRDLAAALTTTLAGCDVCIAHNITTLHKNLALTAALYDVAAAGTVPVIAWSHDLAWANTQYHAELHDGFPWNLLRTPWPNTHYVAISQMRRAELAQVAGLPEAAITMIVGGVDPASFLRLTPPVAALADQLGLFDADLLLLYPTRITRRKNIELALDVLAEMRTLSGRDVRLLITGPPGAHNPANLAYLSQLQNQQQALGLGDSAHFLYTLYTLAQQANTPKTLTDDDLSSLYALADALLFTSQQEGFGIPILEAGLAGLPIFCTDLPPLRETAGPDAHFFAPSALPQTIAAEMWSALAENPQFRLRARVRGHYRWQAIAARQIIPLVEALT